VIEDVHRLTDLQNMLKRMGGVTAVFRVRSETIGAHSFTAFSELMDAYIELCRRNILAKTDPLKEPMAVDDQARSEVTLAFTKIFGQDPAQFLKPSKPANE
jgi:hypothetical protein